MGFWITCGVKMMWLCHGWGWQPPQTAFHIHIRHAHSTWAHLYVDHRHMVEALHSYTHPTWLRFWGSGSLVESKWCDHVIVEADSHLKLHPCCKPLRNVPYIRTFGVPDQGQMLDVWGGIQQMSTLRWQWHSYAEKSPPHPGIKSCTNKDIARGISAMILDHTDRN